MKREDFIILIVALFLLAGMLFTLFLGGEKSKHGVGSLHDILPGKLLGYDIEFQEGLALQAQQNVAPVRQS